MTISADIIYAPPETCCGVKSGPEPGTLYSYGPRYTVGTVVKLPCGGGVGVAHSSVVACHGLSSAFLPANMLQKKLMMNGSWNNAKHHAETEIIRFRPSTCWLCR